MAQSSSELAAPPRRGNRLSRGIFHRVLRIVGWRIEGAIPDIPQFVVIIAPHTSNWDFLLCVVAMFAAGLRLSWLGKHTLFRAPLGPLMRWLGGVPVDRGARSGVVEQAVDVFRANDRFVLAVTPEGTRSRVGEWKSGFHSIARSARVPILPVWLDYGARVVGIGTPMTPTADADADTARLRALYHRRMARHPELFSS